MRKGRTQAADNAGRSPQAAGRMTRLAYARARAEGVAVDPLLKKAGLTRPQVEDPRAPIRVRDQIRFLSLVAEALDDDLLGFHLGQAPDLREFGLFYYVVASSETLLDAVQRGVRYSSLVNEGIAQRFTDGETVDISFRYVGVSRHVDRHQIEFWMTALVRVCRQLTGLRLMPSRVRFIHHRELNAELSKFFGDNVEFGAPADDISFSASVRSLPVVNADPYLNKLLVSYAEEALSRQAKHKGSFLANVENAIAPLLPHGKAQADEIARKLGLSRRTFARRLAQEGLTFSQILDGLRSDLANRHLAHEELAISEISWLLGYREVGAFSRAFKRWTGKSPSKARPGRAASRQPAGRKQAPRRVGGRGPVMAKKR